MTTADHAELSAAVARAIGWTTYFVGSAVFVDSAHDRGARVFDYRHSAVCVGLIKWLIKNDCDVCEQDGKPAIFRGFTEGLERSCEYFVGDTLELAVARAVLAVAGEEKP